MTWHRVWLIKCDGDGCSQAYVTSTPEECPQGWATDGSRHLCPGCVAEQQVEPVVRAVPD